MGKLMKNGRPYGGHSTTAATVNYTDTHNIGATNTQDAIDNVVESLDWKLLIEQVGTAAIQFPATWRELWVEVTGTNAQWHNFQFTIPKIFLSATGLNNPTLLQTGFYVAGADYGECAIGITPTGVYLNNVRIGGTEYKTQSTIRVYYR